MKFRLILSVFIFGPSLIGCASITAFGQTGCNCSGTIYPTKGPLQTHMRRFIDAQREGHWDEVAKYLATFELDWKRRKRYHNKQEQEELLQEVRSRRVPGFTVWHGMSSTNEFSYPAEKRELLFEGCARYEEGGEIFSARSSIVVYRDRGRWLFSPASLPPKGINMRSTLPDVPLPGPPPQKP